MTGKAEAAGTAAVRLPLRGAVSPPRPPPGTSPEIPGPVAVVVEPAAIAGATAAGAAAATTPATCATPTLLTRCTSPPPPAPKLLPSPTLGTLVRENIGNTKPTPILYSWRYHWMINLVYFSKLIG